jgi:hypothetical protein
MQDAPRFLIFWAVKLNSHFLPDSLKKLLTFGVVDFINNVRIIDIRCIFASHPWDKDKYFAGG